MFNAVYKNLTLSTRFEIKASIAFIFCALLSFGCGKRTPPLPPQEKIPQRVEINGRQTGNEIFLSWKIPNANALDTSVLNISRAEIYRLVEPLNAPESINEAEFAAQSTKIASIPVSPADFKKGLLTYRDSLQFAGQPARLRYAVRFLNASGQKAGFSNFLLIEPTGKISAAPTLLDASVTQTEIISEWQTPSANIDGTTPANILGYNIYRLENGSADAKLLNSAPVVKNRFSDTFFEFDKNYRYFVRAISVGSNGQPIESADSNYLNVLPKDTFSPAAPEALTIAAAPTSVSLFFAANTERDIAGYRVFRSTNRNLPPADWTNLTLELLKTNTFQDASVEAGKTYFYFVIAVDLFGNQSKPSEIVGETVP